MTISPLIRIAKQWGTEPGLQIYKIIVLIGQTMKQLILAVSTIFIVAFAANTILAEEVPKQTTDPIAEVYHKSLKEKLFVVETSLATDKDGIDRIAGKVDRGYSSPEQSYESDKKRRTGPFDENPQEKTSQVLT